MIENLRKKLPKELVEAYDTISSLRKSQDEWRYVFMNDEEYKEIKDVERAAQIYWTEMLSRVHIIVLISFFKTIRWMESLDDTSKNYYGFCASLRGLIESCGDTFYTLRYVPLTLATDYMVIKEQINKQSIIITDHDKLETELLHYIQATKLTSSQKEIYPKNFNAKQIIEYLKAIADEDDDNLLNLYSYLCGITHPASEANQLFLFLYQGETIVCNDSMQMEEKLIDNLIEANADTLVKMYRAYMNNIVSILLLLNEFGLENLVLTISFEDQFKNTDIWQKIEEFMNKSKINYQNAMKTGEYK